MNVNAVSFGIDSKKNSSLEYLKAQNLRQAQEAQKKKEEEEQKSIYAGNVYTGQQEDPLLEALNEQLSRKEKEIDELSQNQELGQMEKIEKQKQLEEEKKAIQQQINQRQLELQEKERQKEQEELQKKLEKTMTSKSPEEVVKEAEQTRTAAIAAASTTLDQAAQMNKVRVMAEGKLKVAEGELKMAKSYRAGSAASKYQAVADAKVLVQKSTQKMSTAFGKANKAIDDAKASESLQKEKEAKSQVEEKQEEKDKEKEQQNNNKENNQGIGMYAHVNVSL